MASDWNPQAIQEEIDLELTGVRTDGGEVVKKSPEELAKETAVATVPFAMKRAAWIAIYSDNEGLALKASELILNRVFGKVTDIPLSSGSEKDKLRSLVESAYGPQDE